MLFPSAFGRRRQVTGGNAVAAILAVVLCSQLQPGYAATCQPIYPQCTCQTTFLTCAEYTTMWNSVVDFIDSFRNPNATAVNLDPARESYEAGKVVGGIVRLAFHDAGEYDASNPDGKRADGCVDLTKNENGGLDMTVQRLDALWLPHCGIISRADFWYLAASAAVVSSCPYVKGTARVGSQNGQHDHWVIPFRYGRVDTPTCSYTGKRLPSAEGGADEIKTFIMDKFGLDARHAVALLGAHTVGHANITTSGYNSTWKDRSDVFTNAFYRLLAQVPWQRTAMTDPHTGAGISQWSNLGNGARDKFTLMLNTDMSMLYNVRGGGTIGEQCGPYDRPSQPGRPQCPFTSTAYPELDFATHVTEFMANNGSTRDEPGATPWLLAFGNAFAKMSETGYARDALTCLQCAPVTCTACTTEMLCETGALDSLTDPSLYSPSISPTVVVTPSTSAVPVPTTMTPTKTAVPSSVTPAVSPVVSPSSILSASKTPAVSKSISKTPAVSNSLPPPPSASKSPPKSGTPSPSFRPPSASKSPPKSAPPSRTPSKSK